MEMTIGELVDRLTIELRKRLCGFQGNNEMLVAIFDDLRDRFGSDILHLVYGAAALGVLNDAIASLEGAIRGDEGLPLEEVGRRALAIRDLNDARVHAKNQLSRDFGEPESPLYYTKAVSKATD